MNHQLFKIAKSFCLIGLLFAFSACSPTIHKDFLQNLIDDQRIAYVPFKSPVVGLAYDDKGKYLAVGHESGIIDIWNAKEARSKTEIKAHDSRVNLITFSADGSCFFTNSTFEQSTKLWDTKTGRLLLSIPKTRGPVFGTPDENIYLIGDGAVIRVFDFARKSLLPESYESSGVVTAMAMDAVSERIAVGTASGSIEIWKFQKNSAKEKILKTLSATPYAEKEWVDGLKFSPDGTTLFSVSRFGSVDEWTTIALEKKRTIPTTLKHLHSAAFIKGKQLLALGGTEDSVGVNGGYVELVSLEDGSSIKYRANTNLPIVEFIPPLDIFISAQRKTIGIHPLTTK